MSTGKALTTSQFPNKPGRKHNTCALSHTRNIHYLLVSGCRFKRQISDKPQCTVSGIQAKPQYIEQYTKNSPVFGVKIKYRAVSIYSFSERKRTEKKEKETPLQRKRGWKQINLHDRSRLSLPAFLSRKKSRKETEGPDAGRPGAGMGMMGDQKSTSVS